MPDYQKIVLDTNFLLIPGQFGVDIFDEMQRRLDFRFKLFILEGSIAELDRIIEKDKKKDKIAAKIAKELLKAKDINIIGSEPDEIVDDRLVILSQEGYIIATQDRELKGRIKNRKIILRQKKYIELVR